MEKAEHEFVGRSSGLFGAECARQELISNLQDLICFSLFMYSGVITRSTLHFYLSFISKQRQPLWSPLFFAGFHFCFSLQSSETHLPSTT